MKPKANPSMRTKQPLSKRLADNWQLYLLLLIPVVLTLVYKYIPMYGIQIAFRDYKASRGMFGSRWVPPVSARKRTTPSSPYRSSP